MTYWKWLRSSTRVPKTNRGSVGIGQIIGGCVAPMIYETLILDGYQLPGWGWILVGTGAFFLITKGLHNFHLEDKEAKDGHS